MTQDSPRLGLALACTLGLGLLLRVMLVLSAEHQLDADEATVGVMALDILDGRALPFFFYHQAYNGGAAIEAYFAALIFAIAGPSALALKLAMCAWWAAAALLFADLCRGALPARQCILTLLFFCVGTPFLLEWSTKARGGYAETLLVSLLLLWIARPAQRRPAPTTQGLGFGIAAGLGLWASEMLLPMLPCAAAWLLAQRDREERARMAGGLAVGLLAGLVPLLIYNLTHDWAHLAQSTLASVATGGGAAPLSLKLLSSSVAFVLGPLHWLLLLGLVLGAVRIARTRPVGLPHVLLLHTALYALAFWLAGSRFVPEVAPSRVLYATYPGLAVLLASAVLWSAQDARWRRALSTTALALWLAVSLASVVGWAASGLPRESGSWRGSWSLVDGRELYRALTTRGIDTAIVSYWTRWPLEFAARAERARHPDAPALAVSMSLSTTAEARTPAFVLLTNTPLLAEVERSLLRRRIPFFRSSWQDFTILSGIDAAELGDGLGLPAVLDRGAWSPPPDEPDGFN